MKKYEYTDPKHKKHFQKWNIKAFPTIIIAKGDVKISKVTGYRKREDILKLKGADDAKKSEDEMKKTKLYFRPDAPEAPGALVDIELCGRKVADNFPPDTECIELRVFGVSHEDVRRVPHDPNRPIEVEYVTLPDGTAAIVLPPVEVPEEWHDDWLDDGSF